VYKIVINVDWNKRDDARNPSNDTVDSIPSEQAKLERSALITYSQRDTPPKEKETNLNPEDQTAVDELKRENQTLQTAAHRQKRNSTANCVMETRGEEDGILKGYQSILQNKFYPAFHSQTPEDFHKRLTFLQQCTRQGSAIRSNPQVDANGITRVKNSVFGRQPICILRLADFYYTKVVIDNINIDYEENIWDTNPEGFGMQPMVANVTIQMKVIGGQSLKGPIDALQNAVSFNYYANSTITDTGLYSAPSNAAAKQQTYNEGIVSKKK
ncbi:unnamed protein product, partial [marine sediment metagenome]